MRGKPVKFMPRLEYMEMLQGIENLPPKLCHYLDHLEGTLKDAVTNASLVAQVLGGEVPDFEYTWGKD